MTFYKRPPNPTLFRGPSPSRVSHRQAAFSPGHKTLPIRCRIHLFGRHRCLLWLRCPCWLLNACLCLNFPASVHSSLPSCFMMSFRSAYSMFSLLAGFPAAHTLLLQGSVLPAASSSSSPAAEDSALSSVSGADFCLGTFPYWNTVMLCCTHKKRRVNPASSL